jgi:hypothetical protein
LSKERAGGRRARRRAIAAASAPCDH